MSAGAGTGEPEPRAAAGEANAPRPLIGLCAALETARWAVWDMPADLLPRMYVDALQKAGGAPVLLPVDAGWAEDPGTALDALDGLVLAGGSDVDPATYGAEPHPKTFGALALRDACELALLKEALARDLPVLGICRGMQLMNVARGGTLHQHLTDVIGDRRHQPVLGTFEGADHTVVLEAGSLAARAAGATEISPPSHHHQAVDVVGEGVRVSGRSPSDDLVEAIEIPGRAFALGVQWHPEADPADRVIESFVAAAAARSSSS